MRKSTITLIFVVLTFSSWGQQIPDFKKFSQTRIFDYANMLSTQQVDSLSGLIKKLEQKIGAQIAIWTQAKLRGQTIDELAFKTINKLDLGRTPQNDGILICISATDRQARIEVGTGLENIIKDEIAARLLREDLIPNFKLKKYGHGLYVTIDKISKLITDNVKLIGTKPQYLQKWDSLKTKEKN
jgi:uncharacterized membrane protein YgcG